MLLHRAFLETKFDCAITHVESKTERTHAESKTE